MPESCCSGSSGRRRRQPCNCGKPADTNAEPCCPAPEPEPPKTEEKTCGCTAAPAPQPWMDGAVDTPAGPVSRVKTTLEFADVFGSWKARWSIGRMDYTVEPGLYCVGTPGPQSPVLVTANYKMTFDRLRKELDGVDAWVLVLDTKGINVWCAAGKGTFGTEELVRRISLSNLKAAVSHRVLILPQLGAIGVAAHEVTKQTGFHVEWGPVRAEDLKEYLENSRKATEAMRTVRFTLWDRLVLTPMELVGALKPALVAFGILFILNAVGFGHYGGTFLAAVLGAILVGAVLTPVLLPWIPGRAFSLKGFLLGLLWAAGAILLFNIIPLQPVEQPLGNWLTAAGYLLLLPALSAFCAMNFTGSSTFTSMSGVDKEMKVALPLMLVAGALGSVALLANDIILLIL